MKRKTLFMMLFFLLIGIGLGRTEARAEEIYDGPPYLNSDVKLISGEKVGVGDKITFSAQFVTNVEGCFVSVTLKQGENYYYLNVPGKFFSGNNQFSVSLDENYLQENTK